MTAAFKLPTTAQDVAQALEQAIRRAVDRQGLEAVLVRVQQAFEAGQLSQAQALRLGDLLARQPMVRLRSRLLGEVVLLAADDAQVPADNGLVVYRASELPQVVGRAPAEVRAIHAVKAALDGEVVAGDG
jgi:hypothetical protein